MFMNPIVVIPVLCPTRYSPIVPQSVVIPRMQMFHLVKETKCHNETFFCQLM